MEDVEPRDGAHWCWSDRALHVEMADGAHAALIADGELVNMDQTAGEVWRCLAEPLTVDDLVSELMRVFDVADETQCREDVTQLLAAWHRWGLVTTT